MIQLSELKLGADTKELDEAIVKVKLLKDAVSGLSESTINIGKKTKSVSDGVSSIGNESTKTESKLSSVEKALERTSDKLKVMREEAIQASDGVISFGKGLTSSQAAFAANLKQMGATKAQLEDYSRLVTEMNAGVGANKFDDSVSGYAKMQKELNELVNVNKLYAQGLGLTREEAKWLARDIEFTTQRMNSEKASTEALNKEIDSMKEKYKALSLARNEAVQSSKAIEASLKAEAQAAALSKNQVPSKTKITGVEDAHVTAYQKNLEQSAKALQYVENESKRATNALNGLNEEVKVSNSNRLLKFEEMLRKSGLSAQEAKTRLDAYKQTLVDTQAKERVRDQAMQQENIAYITRAVAPQLTDIFVGLATGQSPLTIMMQQGGQLTDQFRMANVEAGKMGEVLRNSLASMVPMYLTVGKAIGQTVVGAFVDAGKAVLSYAGYLTFADKLQEALFNKALASAAAGNNGFANFFNSASVAVGNLSGVMTGVLASAISFSIAAVIALGVAFVKTIKEQNESIRTLEQYGASLGMTSAKAYEYAASLTSVHGTVGDTVQIIGLMAKEGGFAADSIQKVREYAVNMAQVTGQSYEELVKKASEVNKKPVEALIELAKQNGLVRIETIKTIEELVKQGRTAEASAKAVDEFTRAGNAMADSMRSQFGILTRLGLTITEVWSKAWNAILNVGRPLTVTENITKVQEKIASYNEYLEKYSSPEKQKHADPRIKKALEDAKGELTALSKRAMYEADNAAMREYNSTQARLHDKFKDEYKKHVGDIADLDKTRLSRAEYVAKNMQKFTQLESEGYAISAKQKEDLKKSIGEEWDKANKQKKDPTESFFESSMKKLRSDATSAQKDIEGLTKAQKDFLDIALDPKFAKLSDSKKIEIANQAELSIQQEKVALSTEAEKKALEALGAISSKVNAKQEDLSETMKKLGDLKASKLWNEMTDAAKANVEAIAKQIDANEGLFTAEERLSKLREKTDSDLGKTNGLNSDYYKRLREIESAYNDGVIPSEKEYVDMLVALIEAQKGVKDMRKEEAKALEDHTKQLAGLQGELDYLYEQAGAIDSSTAARKRAKEELKAYKKLQEDLAGAKTDVDKERATERYTKRLEIAAQRMENEIVTNWTTNISDALTTAIFDGGSAGTKKLRSFLVSELRKQINLSINLLIQPFVQGFVQSLGFGGSGSSGSGSISSFLTNGVSGAIQNGFATFAKSGIGESLGLSENIISGLPEVGNTLTKVGSTFSQAAGIFGNAVAGFGIGNAISNGYGSKAVTSIGAIASAFFGPVAGVIAGLANRLFGRKLKDTGIQGTFSDNKFEGESYQFYKGGLFRSDKTKTSALDDKTEADFGLQYTAIKQSVTGLVGALGLTAPSIETFTKDIKLSFQGLTEDQIQKKIADTFSDITDDLVKEAFTTKTQTERIVKEVVAITEGSGDSLVTTYKDIDKTITDTTFTMREDLPEWVKSILTAKGYTKEALDMITEMPDKILSSLGTSAADLSGIIILGMQKGDYEGAGKSFADTLVWGVKNSLYQGFANQITGIITTQMVTPITTAISSMVTSIQAVGSTAMTAASVMSTINMTAIRTQLSNTVAAYKSIFNDPEIKKLIAEIAGLGSLVSDVGEDSGFSFESAPTPYADSFKATNDAIDKANKDELDLQKKFEEEKKKLLADSSKIEIEYLREQGKEAEALSKERDKLIESYSEFDDTQRKELIALHDANELKKKELENLKKLNSLKDDYLNLEIELLNTQGLHSKAKEKQRQLDIKGMDAASIAQYDLNEARRREIEVLQKQVQLLDDFTSSVDLFLKPEDALKFKYNTLAYKVSGIGFGDVTGEQLAKVEPSKIREFVNAMMQSSDVSVEAKSDILNYARQLLELNNDLDSFAENISSVKEEYQSNTDYALELLQKSIEKEKELAETSLESHEKSVDSLKSIFDMLEEYIRDLLKQVESTSKNAAIKGRELISKAITTGILPAEKDLKKAIDDVKSNVESTKYKDKFQADRARLLLAIDLKKLQDLTGEQLTDAEKQLSATKDQIKQYDTMLRKYQDQIDIMRGTYSATLKVVDAITLLEAAITSELSKTKQLQSQAILGSNGAVFNTKTLEGKNAKGAGFNSEQLLRDAIKHLESGGSPQSVLDAIASSGFTFGQAETILGLPSGTLNDYAALNSWVKSTISSGKLNPSDLSGSTISPTQTIVTNSGAMYDPTTNIGVNTQGVAWNVSDVAAEAQRMISAGMVSDVVAAIQSQGFSVSQAEKILGINIPEYATGINYVPSDRLAMIHKGEAVVPARFNPSVFASNSESDDEDMQNLRAEVRAVVTHVSKLSRNIDRLIVPTTSGEALQTKAVV